MPRIFFIGKGHEEHAGLLSSNGYEVARFGAPKAALPRLGDAGLLVMDRGSIADAGDLLRASRHLPKLVISTEGSTRSLGPWLRQPLAYPLHEPTGKELLYYAGRLLREADALREMEGLRLSLSAMKDELAFFEEMNKILTSSRDIHEVLARILKRVKDAIGAEAWSVFLVEETTGEMVLETSSVQRGKKAKKAHLRPGEGAAGWVVEHGRPLLMENVGRKDLRGAPAAGLHGRVKARTMMCAPLKIKGRVLGVVEIINKHGGGEFGKEDLAFLVRLMDQTALAVERITLHQRLEEMSVTDDLTSLFNTRYLNRSIESEITRSKRHATSVSVIFMDIDKFKDINDNYGHLVGSKLLVEVGQLLINELRSIDVVARYGGDEFVIVLPQTFLNNALSIAERIRRAMERHVFLRGQGYNLRITASFGVATYPESAQSKEDMLRIADESMYQVKRQTRNGVYAII